MILAVEVFLSVHVCIYKSIHTHCIVYFLLKIFKAVTLSIKLAVISRVKQLLLKKLCEHVTEVLIKPSKSSTVPVFLAEATHTGIPHPETIIPQSPYIKQSSLNSQNIHGKLEKM